MSFPESCQLNRWWYMWNALPRLIRYRQLCVRDDLIDGIVSRAVKSAANPSHYSAPTNISQHDHYNEKTCAQNGITLTDGDMSSGLSCVHMPILKLSNAILNTFQIPPDFYIMPSDLILSQTQHCYSTISTTNHRTGITGLYLLWCFVSNCVPVPFRTCFQWDLVTKAKM